MKIEKVAVQLYTVKDYLKTPADIAKSLRRIRDIGYQAVQTFWDMYIISDEELFKILRDEGLSCCSTHESGDELLTNPERCVQRLKVLNAPMAAYPMAKGFKCETLEDVKSFAGRLNTTGKVFYEAGLIFCYHNHNHEFLHFDGRTMLEIIYEETDPRYVQAELDTYWIQLGGGNPVDWCHHLKKRLPQIHLKDYRVVWDKSDRVITRSLDFKADFAEIGQGNLDWGSIIPAAEEAGCQWFIVEQDTCPGDPFDSLKLSFDYMLENLCAS